MAITKCGKLGDLLNNVSISNEKVQKWKEQKDLVSFSYKNWYSFIEHNKSFKIFDAIIDDIKNNYTYLDHVSVYSCWSKIQEYKLVLPEGIQVNWNNRQGLYEVKNIIEWNKSESLLALIQYSDNIRPASAEVTKLLEQSLNLSNRKTVKLIKGLVDNVTNSDSSLGEIRSEFHNLLEKLGKALVGGLKDEE